MINTRALAELLISKESVTPKDEGCQEIIAQFLAELGFEIQHFPYEAVNNLWATYGKAPYFCFAGHTDVVPPGELSRWQSEPFVPTVRNGKLYGRGAQDMKSSIAAMMIACRRFLKQNPNTNYGIAFLITSDEEGLAIHGTQAVLKQLATQNTLPKWCLVGEASSTKQLGDMIKVGRRGSLNATLVFEGKQGHVAYPTLAQNPIHHSAPILDKICSIEWDHGNDYFPPTSLQFSNIHSGTGADNVIPGQLETKFNLRYSTEITHEQIQNRIETILQESTLPYRIQWRLSGKPFLTASNSSFVSLVSNTIEKTLGLQPEHSTSGGTSDGRFFAEYGIDVVEFGPVNDTIHQVNECISLEELDKLSEAYEAILFALEDFSATLSRT